MQHISLFMNITLDGYFEGFGHDISFFTHDDESSAFAREQSAGGALLLGKNTYDMMAAFWPTPAAEAMDASTAKIMNETQKYVVSDDPFEPTWANTTVINGDVMAQIKKLKETEKKDITVLGSNALAVTLLDARLLDEIALMINPVALGAGTPLFKGLTNRTSFTLQSTREFKSGNVLLTYACGTK